MIPRLNQFHLLGLLFCGLICFLGCNQKPANDSTQLVDYAVETPYQQGPLKVHLRLSADQIELSGLLTMELSATIGPDYEVQFPLVAEALEQFRVRSWDDQSAELPATNQAVTTYRYQLEPLELGSCKIPAFTFTFNSLDDSSITGTLTTEPISIEVTSSLPDDPEGLVIADIDEVVEMKADYTWLWIAMGIIIVLLISVMLYRHFRPEKAVVIKRKYKSAHEIALATLKVIGRENLVEQGLVKEFYEKLSTCLRQYIENRFQLRAPEQTTEEFLEQLKRSEVLELEHKQELQKFLEHCDLVKFARYSPTVVQINESLAMAKDFVRTTSSDEHLVDVTEEGGR